MRQDNEIRTIRPRNNWEIIYRSFYVLRLGKEDGMLLYLLTLAFAARCVWSFYRLRRATQAVEKLGQRAPVVRTYLPFGMYSFSGRKSSTET
jgi:uncharacterized membrane protein